MRDCVKLEPLPIPSDKQKAIRYFPQLDGLRMLAISGVLVSHFFPRSIGGFFPLGPFGVRLFFVLSGFLITGILLAAREHFEHGKQDLGYTLRSFYIRRSLRIFVIYYLWTLGMAFAGMDYQGALPYHLTYTTNLYSVFALNGAGMPAGHYWTLAVEEQFYLIWPLVLFSVPRKHMRSVFIAIILASVLSRLGGAVADLKYNVIKKFTLNCFDGFAIGGLLSICLKSQQPMIRKLAYWAILVGVPMLAVSVFFHTLYGIESVVYKAFVHTSLTLVSLFLVYHAVVGYTGTVKSFLENSTVCYIGKISYGMYLFHLFVPNIMRKWGYESLQNMICRGHRVAEIIIQFIAYTAVTVLLASASWYLIEVRVNGLKRYFPMLKRTA